MLFPSAFSSQLQSHFDLLLVLIFFCFGAVAPRGDGAAAAGARAPLAEDEPLPPALLPLGVPTALALGVPTALVWESTSLVVEAALSKRLLTRIPTIGGADDPAANNLVEDPRRFRLLIRRTASATTPLSNSRTKSSVRLRSLHRSMTTFAYEGPNRRFMRFRQHVWMTVAR